MYLRQLNNLGSLLKEQGRLDEAEPRAPRVLLREHAAAALVHVVALAAVLIFGVFFGFGVGPIPGLIVAEMFEAAYVDTAQSIACQVNWVANFVVGAGFPFMNAALGGWAFVPFDPAVAEAVGALAAAFALAVRVIATMSMGEGRAAAAEVALHCLGCAGVAFAAGARVHDAAAPADAHGHGRLALALHLQRRGLLSAGRLLGRTTLGHIGRPSRPASPSRALISLRYQGSVRSSRR